MKIKQLLQTFQIMMQSVAQRNRSYNTDGLAVRTGVQAGNISAISPELYSTLQELGVNFVTRDLPQPSQPRL